MQKQTKESLWFIVFKRTDELASGRVFGTKRDAQDYFDESSFNKKIIGIQERTYIIKP